MVFPGENVGLLIVLQFLHGMQCHVEEARTLIIL